MRNQLILLLVISGVAGAAPAQDAPLFTPFLPAAEFQARRAAIYDAIGDHAVALVQGAGSEAGYTRFRQSNEFFYLTGVESPHAYLVIDGQRRSSQLYLPNRDARREASEGKLLAAEDDQLVRRLAGVDAVYPSELLSEHLARLSRQQSGIVIFTPFAPAEGAAMSRDLAARAIADRTSDPWDGRPSREGHLKSLLRQRFPGVAVQDLSPVMDSLRLIKSDRELALIRRATEISRVALMETMRSVQPGVMEYEIDALAQFVFLRHGAQHTAYYSLVGAGPNAWYPHYHAGGRAMRDGDFLLVDVGPDFAYYSTDITRMMPVNGVFSDWQSELYGFYLACYRAILDNIRPGEVADIMRGAAAEMQRVVDSWSFSKPHYESAARAFVGRYVASAERGTRSLGHWVGMAVHDVGVHDGILRPGMVFTIEPQFRVPEEQIYIRLEDLVVITDGGAEVLTAGLPMDIDAIEELMRSEGLLQRYPALLAPLQPRLPASPQSAER